MIYLVGCVAAYRYAKRSLLETTPSWDTEDIILNSFMSLFSWGWLMAVWIANKFIVK